MKTGKMRTISCRPLSEWKNRLLCYCPILTEKLGLFIKKWYTDKKYLCMGGAVYVKMEEGAARMG